MIILAIDCGVEKNGYAIFNKDNKYQHGYQFIASGLLTTARTPQLEKRLATIYEEFKKIIDKHKPAQIILEKIFFFRNQKTVISVAQAQGTILVLAAQKQIYVRYLTPLQIKQFVTGYGRADKKSIQKMLGVLLARNFKQDDEADAVACGLAYCNLNENLV